ncbi:ribosome biogenesis GTP-binding protein YihA/YsxC [Kiloniella laminariae]|uniref:Probable GTP-binding protein EngB n=1 Tax=Kiloniella laminariae TaxID=454162 RepID=A0ABT4LKI4_9PROT|nr:ribosome biogenesis GTP-binding protein YihA/YsxC [Kiloniella laminariae]MCZ4281600.1 ribosome biogenesis GTP-binding protein YihA/YsxC [Kiloniella laminariae]
MTDETPVSIPQSGIKLENPGDDPRLVEAGRLLFTQSCEFILGATKDEHIGRYNLPEVAFAGRSNVGKSSLVNALTGRKTLARTSNTPGRTRQLNFFDLGKQLMLVDLPGYGYAQASKSDIAYWTNLTRNYLRGRAELKRILLLIDARHGTKDSDREIMDELDTCAVSYQIIMTKVDKTKASELAAEESKLAKELSKRPAAHPYIVKTSSMKGQGVSELRAILASLVEQGI